MRSLVLLALLVITMSVVVPVARQTMFLLTEASEEWGTVPENKGKLGKILTTDPLAHYFGARKGNVFKMIERSPTAGEIVKYFLVS